MGAGTGWLRRVGCHCRARWERGLGSCHKPCSSNSRRALLVVAICQSPLESRRSKRRQRSLAKALRLSVGSVLSSAITSLVFSGAASVCLMDELDCIAQGITGLGGVCPVLFSGASAELPWVARSSQLDLAAA